MSRWLNGLCVAVMAITLPRLLIGQENKTPAQDKDTVKEAGIPGYILGPDDVISVRVLDAEEISDRPLRIDMAGYVRLPLVGRMRAGGLTVDQFESDLRKVLTPFIKTPDVSVSITEFRSQPVSVIGSVKTPGIHQLQGRKTLVEVLSLAGGLADDAGPAVKVTRMIKWGPIPLPSAETDSTKQFSVAEIKLRAILTAQSPEQNIVILPNDVISIPRAEMIYVTGTVMRSGGFVLNEKESLSVLQALSLAGGLDRAASPRNTRILRVSQSGGGRSEIPIDLGKILQGKAEDLALKPNDILFIPASAPKKAALRAVEAAIQTGTGIAIWRR